MPTPKKGARLGGSPAHQKLIVSNLATALFEHGRITTTEARARVLRPVAEKLITKAKRGDLHNRREVLKTIRDKSVVHIAVHRDRAELRGAAGWLHPDHQDRSAQGRQRPHGGHRAGDREVRPEAGPHQEEGRARQGRRPGARRRGDRGSDRARRGGVAEESVVAEAEVEEATDEAPAEEAAAEEAPEAEAAEEAPAEEADEESDEDADKA